MKTKLLIEQVKETPIQKRSQETLQRYKDLELLNMNIGKGTEVKRPFLISESRVRDGVTKLQIVTQEEKEELLAKWGNIYEDHELIWLEQFYQDMLNSYEVNTASRKDYLKKICKVSLKADQALDKGQTTEYDKWIKSYNTLMNSAGFSEAKSKDLGGASSIGELIAFVEKDGFIPMVFEEEKPDIVDKTIIYLQEWTRDLIKSEYNLGSLFEEAISKIMRKNSSGLDDDDEFIDGSGHTPIAPSINDINKEDDG